MYQKKKKGDDIRKYNVLNIYFNVFNDVGTTFTGTYLHYQDAPKETMFERSIAERIKLRKERFDEIKRKEQNRNSELCKAYFTDYQSPSNMYKKYVQKARQKTQK